MALHNDLNQEEERATHHQKAAAAGSVVELLLIYLFQNNRWYRYMYLAGSEIIPPCLCMSDRTKKHEGHDHW